MFSKTFLKAAAERACKTFAQAAIALLGVNGLGLVDVDWTAVGSVAGLAALVSLLTSVISSPFGPVGSPSVVEDANATGRHAA